MSNSPIPENNIKCLVIDGHKKWVGTDNGLALFNDTNWTIYNTSNSPLTDNYVVSLSLDTNRTLWIGTTQSGAFHFDGTNWVNYNSANSGLPNDFVRSFAFDHQGNVWIGTTDGLAKFDRDTTWQVWNFLNAPLLSTNITSIVIGEDNRKFFSTINGGMYEFNDTTFTSYTIASHGLPDNSAVRLVMDSTGNRWYASPAGGLMVHYDFNFWAWYNTINSGIGTNAITYVMVDSLEQKYMCSMQRGLIRFTPPSTFTIWDTANSPLPGEYTQCVEKEKNHIVWLGTREHGLIRIDENPTTIVEWNVATPLQLFPNPARSGAQVSSSVHLNDAKIVWSSVTGQVVATDRVTGSLIDVPQVPAGLYVVQIASDAGTTALRIIIK